MEQFPQEMGNQNTPAMSDHVVVKRESLRLILHAARHLTSYLRTEEQEALDDLQDSYEGEPPAMVPKEQLDEAINFIKQLNGTTHKHASHYRSSCGRWLAAFNAKFKV